MSNHKKNWVNLQVCMDKELYTLIHEEAKMAGSCAAAWGREAIMQALPDLLKKADRFRAVLAVLSEENSLMDGPRSDVRKRPHAARIKERRAGQARRQS